MIAPEPATGKGLLARQNRRAAGRPPPPFPIGKIAPKARLAAAFLTIGITLSLGDS